MGKRDAQFRERHCQAHAFPEVSNTHHESCHKFYMHSSNKCLHMINVLINLYKLCSIKTMRAFVFLILWLPFGAGVLQSSELLCHLAGQPRGAAIGCEPVAVKQYLRRTAWWVKEVCLTLSFGPWKSKERGAGSGEAPLATSYPRVSVNI